MQIPEHVPSMAIVALGLTLAWVAFPRIALAATGCNDAQMTNHFAEASGGNASTHDWVAETTSHYSS